MRLPPWLWNLLTSRKMKIFLAVAPFALCLLVLLFYFVAAWWGRLQAERQLQHFESAGYAVDPEKYWVPAKNPENDLFGDPLFQEELRDRVLSPLDPGHSKNSGLARRLPKAELGLAKVTELARWVDPPMPDDRAAAEHLLKQQHAVVERLEALRPVLSRSKEAVWPAEPVRNAFLGGAEVTSVAGPMMRLRQLSDAAGEIAVFHLATGEGAKASGAVEAMLDILRLELDPKPTLTSVLIADAMSRRVQAVIWEGVVRGSWSDGQLRALDEQLATLRPQQAAVKAHLGEIAQLRSQTNWSISRSARALPELDDDWRRGWEWDHHTIWERTKEIASRLRPPGFELAEGVKSQREFLDRAARSDGAPRERFTAQDLAEFHRMREASATVGSIHSASSGTILAVLASSTLRMEATIAVTRTGIALERYRLGSGDGRYPSSLEALVPAFLPHVPADPFSGQPVRYQLQADGSPHLWSVGGNFIDDGGLPHIYWEEGDLIWITRPIPGFTSKDLRR